MDKLNDFLSLGFDHTLESSNLTTYAACEAASSTEALAVIFEFFNIIT